MLNQTKAMSALMCVLAAYLSGCAIVESAQPLNVENEKKPALLTAKANEVALVLAFFQRIRGLPADSLAAEYALATQALAKQRSDTNRLRLALLLSLPNTAFRDDGRATSLAEETLANKAMDAELKLLALYIAAVAGEQKRQEDRYQAISQKLKEEERRAEARQQKLDALKTIEKDLINREQTKPLRVK